MKVTILGSGSFFIDKDHSAPAYLINVAGKNILFDCGPGTLVQLAKIGFDPLKLDFVFLSHFHNDHTSDLVAILFRPYILETYYGGSFPKKLHIVGPKGVEKFTRDLCGIFHHNGVPDYNKLEYIDFQETLEFDGFKVKAFSVEHLDQDAYALRLEAEDKVLVYTGDAVLSEGVTRAVKNADLLIADCATPKKYPANAHLGTHQVGEICRDNGVKKVILSHQVPPGYNVDMVGEVQEVWPQGDIVLARDLMEEEI